MILPPTPYRSAGRLYNPCGEGERFQRVSTAGTVRGGSPNLPQVKSGM